MKDRGDINILCVGECMLELRSHGDDFVAGFAGDIINFSIYLKRLSPSTSVNFLSATGEDPISERMRAFLSKEAINTQLVFTTPDKTVGLYMVHTDDTGERTFSYWRSDSAARQMFYLADEALLYQSARAINYLYFSGITLAILDQAGRDRLISLAQLLHSEGISIIFDPNFRPSLWQSLEQARIQTARAYEVCNILLSSHDDEQILFGDSDIKSIMQRLMPFAIDEIVITDGPDEIYSVCQGEQFTTLPAKPTAVVDTTSAGDSFNAAYIVARHKGYSARDSVARAAALSAVVVAHSGAIIPEELTEPLVQ